MRSDTRQLLDERLRALDPVDREAMGTADVELMRAILSGERQERDVRRPRGVSRLASLAAALAVALAAGGIATAPGQAVTSWVGQRIGVDSPARTGQPGGRPSEQSLREFAHQGASPAGGQPAIVVARGDLPYGRHYEVVAYRPKPAGGGAAAEPVCFELDFPEVRSLGTAGCELPASGTSLVFQQTGENASATQAFSYAIGLAGEDVAAVDVAVPGRRPDVQLVRIPADLLKQFGVDRPVKLFMATFGTGAGGTVTATARNAAGARLDEGSIESGG